MSFAAYLLYGPTYSFLSGLGFNDQLKNIMVIQKEDCRETINVHQDSIKDHSSLWNKLPLTVIYIVNNDEPLIILYYSSLRITNEIWERFRSLSVLTRNIASFLTLGCLGCIYWKHLPGKSVFTICNLIAGIAAAAFAFIARIAHLRTNMPWPEKLDKAIGEITLGIGQFRKEMLAPTNNIDYDFTLTKLPDALRNRPQDFFTKNEIFYFLTKRFFSNEIEPDFNTLYDFYVDRKQLTTDSPNARFVNAYAEFRKSIDFEEMKNEVLVHYSDWVKKNIEPSINSALSLLNEKDQNLFNQSFKKMISFDLDTYTHNKAFKQVCNTIKSKPSLISEEATKYLKTLAVEDFKKYLFTSCLLEHFIDVLSKIEKQLDVDVISWLINLFKTIPDETVKTILLESTSLDQDSITSSHNPLNETISDENDPNSDILHPSEELIN